MSDPILKRMFNLMYPIGSIYMSINSTSPAILFGGTWEQIKDRFLLACGNSYSNGATGGSASVTLNVNQIPSHNHYVCSRSPSSNLATRGSDIGAEFLGSDVTTSFKTTNTGGTQSHENMPPYLAVYIWKRTA